jgi:4,5-DOPA dioxygenase extradiol
MSMPTLDPRELHEIGRKLTPLRDQDVLIVGSGFMTHNLSCVNMGLAPDYAPPSWSAEFDDWAGGRLAEGDVDALLDFQAKAPAAGIAHPRTEHFAPLFVALGAAGHEKARTSVEGFWYGLSKRSVQFS